MSHTLAANLRARNFNPTLVAHCASVPDALVLAAVALPVLAGTENPLAKEATVLRLQGAIVDRFWLGNLTIRPATNILG